MIVRRTAHLATLVFIAVLSAIAVNASGCCIGSICGYTCGGGQVAPQR